MPNLPFLQLLISTGGSWVIYLLFVLSVMAVAVIIERTIIIGRQYKYQEKILPSLSEEMEEKSPEGSLKLLRSDTILFRIAKDLLDHASKGFQSLERHLETRMSDRKSVV